MTGRAPVITSAAARHFWDACREHRYLLQRCADCRTFRYPPGRVCPACLGRNVEWVDSPGRGTVFTYTTVSRAPGPDFEPYAPYTVALIDLAEGVRVMGNLVGCEPDSLRIGLPVQVCFQDVGAGIVLPQFEPAGGR